MYKLLTEEHKEKVAREYSLRRIVIILWALVSVTIICIVGFFPSYLLSQVRNKEVAERLEIMGVQGLSGEDVVLQKWLKDFNLKLKTLSPMVNELYPSAYIEKVASAKVPSIRLVSIEWKVEAEKPVILLSGIAGDRQALVSFERSLNSLGSFSDFEIPISNLARDKDIGFQVKLGIK